MNYKEIAEYLLKLEIKAYKKCSKQKILISEKGAHDLLTTLDTSLEKFIIGDLNRNFSDTKIVSEEYNSKIKACGTYFVIDPVDGTINFANGLENSWGIQMAYVENDIIVSSAIYFPTEKNSFIAAKGFGAFKNGKLFECEKKDSLHSLISIDTREMERYSKALIFLSDKILKHRHSGAACVNFVLMAQGKYGGMLQFDGNPWDIYPGMLMVEEAKCFHKKYKGFIAVATNIETLNLIVEAIKTSL